MPLYQAAMKTGMDEKTARKYRDSGRQPSELAAPHGWRTREDPFEAHWPEVEAMLVDAPEPAPVLIAINDNHADGRDVSWLWDVRFEDLGTSEHRFGVSGIRAADMALRLKYADIDCWAEPNLELALRRVVGQAGSDDVVYVVPTYTAMLDLLDLLLPGASRSEAWS